MNNYILRLDDDKLICRTPDNKRLSKKEIFTLLHYMDSSKNNKIFYQGNNIIIRNVLKGYYITLDNPIDIVNSKYKLLLKNTYNTINENIALMQKDKAKNKKLLINTTIKTVEIMTPLILMATLTTCNLDNSIQERTINEPIPFEDLKEDIVISSEINYADNKVLPKNEEITIEEEDNNNMVSLDIVDNSKNEEVIEIQSRFNEECVKAGKKRGISPDILKGILTQESHGAEKNLMQISFSAFEDQIMDVYNYNEDKWEKVVITKNPNNYKDIDITINEEELNNPYTNIATAAIILNYSANLLKTDNVFALIDFYNKGYGNFFKNMTVLEKETGKTAEEVLQDFKNTSILDYSYVCEQGDPNYFYNVGQYIPNTENGSLYFYRIEDGNKKLITVNLDRNLTDKLVKN